LCEGCSGRKEADTGSISGWDEGRVVGYVPVGPVDKSVDTEAYIDEVEGAEDGKSRER